LGTVLAGSGRHVPRNGLAGLRGCRVRNVGSNGGSGSGGGRRPNCAAPYSNYSLPGAAVKDPIA